MKDNLQTIFFAALSLLSCLIFSFDGVEKIGIFALIMAIYLAANILSKFAQPIFSIDRKRHI